MFICRRIKRGEKANWSPFCDCVANIGRSSVLKCSCGEEDEGWVEWAWDPGDQGSAVPNPHGTARFIGRGFGRPPSLGSPILLMTDNRQVMFHPSYSSGTAAVRGQQSLEPGMHHYWEVKILTPLYGTDMMVGVGTAAVDLRKDRFKYCSLLGEDNESWGFSYNGNVQHGGHRTSYGYPFGLGSIVGVHVDLWHGRLEFYLNRKPLGVAFTNLHGKMLFPMASSTAAKSGVRLIHASSHPHSLLFSCTHALGIASDASSSSESRPSKRLCLDNCGAGISWNSASVGNRNTNSVTSVHNTFNEGLSLVEVGQNQNPSRGNHSKHCGILSSSSANSTRGTAFCNSLNRTDGAEKGQLSSRPCDVMQCASLVGCDSNFESHPLECGKRETAEPMVEANKTVMSVSKLHHSSNWLSKTLNAGKCKGKDSLQCKLACASSGKTSEMRSTRSENHLSSELTSNSAMSDPYFLTLLQEEDEETTPQLDAMCPRKRKQPPCDFVERIWAIPGLRAKVECSFWWLLGTRRGKGVLDASGDAGTSHKPLIMVDEDDEWGRGANGEILKSGQGESIHHQASEGSVSRACHERLCLMCHPVI